MRRRKISFRHESLQDTKSIRGILKNLTSGIGKGKLTFSDEDDSILMEPEGLLHLKLTASQEDNRQRINIRITWQSEDEAEIGKKTLKVSSK
jgi:amphi-Trp domain-containing protein